MKSIPAAMTWELLARDRGALAAAALTALAFPALIFTALKGQGGVSRYDPSMFVIHIAMVQLNIVCFGGVLVATCYKLSPLYPLPITNAALAGWRLVPAMALLALETLLWTAALNAIFELDWPFAGPAFLSAVALAAVLAAVWLANGSRWSIFGITLVGVVLGFWMKSRYGPLFGQPADAWHSLTLTEGLTLAVFATIACSLAVIGVARSRRGEAPFSLGFVDWLDRVLDMRRSPLSAAPTPAQAQFWYAWRFGWLMPIAVALGLLSGLTIWFFASRDVEALVRDFPGTALLLAGVAMIGVLGFGRVGVRDSLDMGSFLSTQPIATADVARATLRAAALSLMLAWLVWLMALAVIFAAGWSGESLAAWPADQFFRLACMAMLLPWLVLGVFLSFALTGRTKFLFRLFCALTLGYLAIVLISKYTLPPPAHAQVMELLAAAIAIACIATTVWTFAAARRRGLISTATVGIAAAIAAAIFISLLLFFFEANRWSFAGYAGVAAVALAAVAPSAAAPLALTYNRIR